jgi:putative transposase
MSKWRHDAALSRPSDGPYAGRGPRRQYGGTRAARPIPVTSRQRTPGEGHLPTHLSQATRWHQEGVTPRPVVIMVKITLQTQARAPGVVCSTDMAFRDDTLIDDDRRRGQIECNVRDATPYGGVEDFMNVPPTALTHAASFAVFMVNVAHLRLQPFRNDHPPFGSLAWQAYGRGHQYVAETLHLLPQKPAPMVIAQMFDHLAKLGRVHHAEFTLNMS